MSPEIAVVGAGYVGVPLADVFADAGKNVVLVDVDESRVAQLNAGESYIQDVPSSLARRIRPSRSRTGWRAAIRRRSTCAASTIVI